MGLYFADVILPLPLDDLYTYRLKPGMESSLYPGMRVIVPFGKKKAYSALVLKIHQAPPGNHEIKEVVAILDDTPLVFPANIDFWKWIATYYIAPLGDVMNAALPAALKLENANQSALSGTVTEKYKPKIRQVISLSPGLKNATRWQEVLGSLNKSPKQQQLLLHFAQKTELFSPIEKFSVPRKMLLSEGKFSEAVLNQLIIKNILIQSSENVSRLSPLSVIQRDLNLLTNDQQAALDQVMEQFTSKQTVLMHGVTASGKTEIYLQLISQAINNGKQALYLVPEIALTPQIVERLTKVFGQKVAVYHSKLSDAERVEIWHKVKSFKTDPSGSFQVVLGARSAIFLPFSNLGVVIVDEEHETSYKQSESQPRYHARDMAVVMGLVYQAKVLLGSATPSFESYQNARSGKYGFVELTQKYGSAPAPQIIIANIRQAYKRKQMKAMLTPELYGHIAMALENSEQVVLFQNRRGYSPFIECMECGWVPFCSHCDVALTYHRRKDRLTCHYCGYSLPMPKKCSKCQAQELKFRGMGTEKIEDEIAQLFPQARIIRMDTDTTRTRNAFEKIIYQIEHKKVDILIGTQMVSKGLDFEGVSVAGILNADNLLNFPDFRAHERAFQLLMQVSGRPGRKDKKGVVVVQTSQPEHPVVTGLTTRNFSDMFQNLMPERKQFYYPPYYKMVKITVRHKNQGLLDQIADFLGQKLVAIGLFRVMGPEYPLVSRVKLWYLKEIWLKTGKEHPATTIGQVIKDAVLQTVNHKGFSSASILVDVDPV